MFCFTFVLIVFIIFTKPKSNYFLSMSNPEELGFGSEPHGIEKDNYESGYEKDEFGHIMEEAAHKYLNGIEDVETYDASDYEDDIEGIDFYVKVGTLDAFPVQFTARVDPREVKDKKLEDLRDDLKEKAKALDKKRQRAEENGVLFVHVSRNKFTSAYKEYLKQEQEAEDPKELQQFFNKQEKKEIEDSLQQGLSNLKR